MEKQTMKNTKNTLFKWIMAACMLIAGLQGAFALQCEGTIYIKAPESWTMVTLEAGGMFPKLTVGPSGWYEAKAAAAGQGQSFRVNSTGTSYPAQWIDKKGYDVANNESQNADAFTCEDLATGSLYIYEDPTAPGKTAYSTTPPNAKYLFVMIPPDMEDWMSSVPYVSMDGGLTGKPLIADASKCGWYYYVWFNEEISDNVVLFRDDDADREDMIGLNGNWETAASATPIPLSIYFDTYGIDTLYFVPDEEQLLAPGDDGFYPTFPEGVEGVCSYTMAAIIYDTDAQLHPAFSCYSQGGEGCQMGAQGIPATTAVSAVNRCIGVTTGIVNQYLDPNVPQKMRKPTLSTFGANCFINEGLFNQLFNYTQGVNEKSCYNMPFSRSEDGKWEFDSDFFISDGVKVPGGFYPVETTDNAAILAADPNQVPVPAARTKRGAQGAVFYGPALRENHATEGIPLIDVFCNSSSWKGGTDCEGLFADGDGTDAAVKTFYKLPANNDCVLGWSCPDKAPKGWTFYKSGTDTPVKAGVAGAEARWEGQRNQHYCFESHAKFTQKPGLRFNFRGDDDIWVFIDNKLAVDLGGTHLAAPGYVDLDKFEGLSGKLETGNEYDLDIFFCDRRTTMSNVRIKTNMFIRQKTDISAKPVKNPANPAEKTYEMCYSKSGDGSCAAAMTGSDEAIECCGSEIATKCGVQIQYYLVQGNQFSAETGMLMENGKVNKGGIDLTNPAAPLVNQDNLQLGPGRWTLFAYIDGKSKKVATFRMTGEVDVMYGTAQALDSNGVEVKNGLYKFVDAAMGGEMLPIYVSAMADAEAGAKVPLYMMKDDAVGVAYTLDVPAGLTMYYKNDVGSYVKMASGESRTIGVTGVDTVYAYIAMDMMTSNNQTFQVKVTGRTNAATIRFYLPVLSFVDAEGNPVTGQKELPGGGYDDSEYWMNAAYEFYLIALKPNADGTFAECPDCEFDISLSSATSPKIMAATSDWKVVGGKATIVIRSLKEYRYDPDVTAFPPAKIVVIGGNPLISAEYSPVYFREPPVPTPILTDVFDVRGAVPTAEMNIPGDYFSMSQEYLDGIGDSVAIYYHRRIHKDSLPTVICIAWDSSSAEEYEPIELGWANTGDEVVKCNAVAEGPFSCLNVDDTSYCDARIELGGLTLSKAPKTGGTGRVTSYAVFKDKAKEVKQGFPGNITDRIAPVILSARVMSAGESMDAMTLEVSEPVRVQQDAMSSFAFYLNSATSLAEGQRYATATVVANNVSDGTAKITAVYRRGSDGESILSPHVGDYVRFRGTMTDLYWKDDAVIWPDTNTIDTLRATADAAYNWNAPTSYDETTRLPSPWIALTGEAEITVKQNKFAHTGNAPVGENVPVATVYAFPTTKSYEDVKDSVNGAPGHFVMADMNALIFSDEAYADYFSEHKDKLDEVYFFYNVEYFTNLGGYVASQSAKIYCTDETVFGAGNNCLTTGRNLYIAWNMRSDEGRVVATGAYITKLESYVRLGSEFGKKAKQEKTSVWGVKRSSTPYADYNK